LKFRQPFTLRAKESDQIGEIPIRPSPFGKKGYPKGDSARAKRAPIWFLKLMEKIITIPKNLVKEGELILIPRKKYEKLLEGQKITEEDILRWTKEAKILKKAGKLPKLKSWASFQK